MTGIENRRFPRIPHVTSRQIVHLDGAQNPRKNFILTENLSASGIKFTTNNPLDPSQYFLIRLNDRLMRELLELYPNRTDWVRVGDYYLTRVVWVKTVDREAAIHEIGASFVEKRRCGSDEMAVFTELLNVNTLETLPDRARLN